MKYLRRLQIRLVKGTYRNPVRGQLREPRQIYQTFRDIKDHAKETVLGVYLDADLVITSYEVLALGTEREAPLASDEVFRGAIVTKSRYIIIVHNHPAGDPAPSPDDQAWIETLSHQAQIMNKYLLDFVIVGDGRFWSWFDELGGGEYGVGPHVPDHVAR